MNFCLEMPQQGFMSVMGCNSISPLRTLSQGPKMPCVTVSPSQETSSQGPKLAEGQKKWQKRFEAEKDKGPGRVTSGTVFKVSRRPEVNGSANDGKS